MHSLRVIIFDLITFVSLFFLLGIPIYAISRLWISKNWLSVDGTLIGVDPLEVDYTKKRFLYETKCSAKYEYVINGVRYENDLVTFIDIFGFFFISGEYYKRLHKDFVDAFNAKRIVTVYYNKENPAQAILTKELSQRMVGGYFLSALLVVSGWLVAQPLLAYIGASS